MAGTYDGSIRIDTNIDTAGFNKGIHSISGSLGGLKSVLGKIAGLIGTAFAVRTLVNFGKEAVSIASDLQEVENVVTTAFGSMTGQVEEWASRSIQQFGMSELVAKQTASTYMAMSRGMGLVGQAAADMAMDVAGLSADMASFYNAEQDVAATALQSIWTGETETLKKFGVVMTQTNLDAYALKNGYSKLISEMSQAEQVQLRYAYVTDALSLAAGDFAKTSGSWANQTRILSEQWKQLMGILGNGLMQVLTPALQALNQFLSYVIQWANALGKIFSRLFGTAATEFSSAAGDMSAGIGSAAGAEEDLADAAAAANKELRQQMGFDEMNILAEPSGSSGGNTGSTGSVGELITAADTAESAAETTTNRVQQKLESLLEWFKQAFAPAISAWGDAFTTIAPAAEDAANRIGTAWSGFYESSLAPFAERMANDWVPRITNAFSTAIAPILGEVMPVMLDELAKDFEWAMGGAAIAVDGLTASFEFCVAAFEEMMTSISASWETHGGALLDGFVKFRDWARELWGSIWAIIEPIVANIGEKVTWLWEEHLKPLWDRLVEAFMSIGENLMILWNGFLAPLLDFILNTIGPVVIAVINTIVDVLFVVFGVVADVIGGILTALDGVIQFIAGVFTGDWKRAWDGVGKILIGVWDVIWGAIRGVINLVISAINLLIKAIWGVIAGIINGIGSIAKQIGKLVGKTWGWHVPAQPAGIPLLAQGAVLPANRPFLAVVGDQKNGTNIEAPLSTIKQAVAEVLQEENGGGDRPVYITIKVGSDTLGVAALKSINQLTRQTGRLELNLA